MKITALLQISTHFIVTSTCKYISFKVHFVFIPVYDEAFFDCTKYNVNVFCVIIYIVLTVQHHVLRPNLEMIPRSTVINCS